MHSFLIDNSRFKITYEELKFPKFVSTDKQFLRFKITYEELKLKKGGGEQ